jgi:hypothetical protein
MVLLLLAGCELFGGGAADGAWIDQTPACDADPYAWSDDLLSFVLAGPGNGTFEFDPDDLPRTGIDGAYSAQNGTFGYSVSFDEDYFLHSAETDGGVGTAWHNGDLDIEYTWIVTDKRDEVTKTGVRVERQGCDQTEWTWDATSEAPIYTELSGTWTEGGFEWSIASDEATWTGERRPDLGESQSYEANNGNDTETIESSPDGTVDREWTIKERASTYEGTDHTNFDGSWERSYKIVINGETYCRVDGAYEYSGDGTEDWDCGDTEYSCEIDQKDDGSCTRSCDNGQDGAC